MEYIGNCVGLVAQDIMKMKCHRNKVKISVTHFLSMIGRRHIENLFPEKDAIPNLKKDPCVSFYRSSYKGKTCYYMEHSRIEYVFQD